MQFTNGLIEQIENDETAFCKFFAEYAQATLGACRLSPRLSMPRLVEIHGAWRADLKRVGKHEKALMEGLDHFKRSGHLAFWVRRFTPLVEASDNKDNLGDAEGYDLSKQEVAFRDLLFGYGNEYLAFDIGYQFSRQYELSRAFPSERAKTVKPSSEYIAMMCHFLKYKTVSPHAMSMIYKSLFLS